MQLERVRKNHMDVEWHEYTDENLTVLKDVFAQMES